MFKLILSPQSSDRDTAISASGNILTIDGTAIDFSPLGEGQQVECSAPLIGIARRVGGVVEVTVLLQYNSATAESMQSTNADDYVINLSSGPAPDVIRRRPVAPELVLPSSPEILEA